MTTNIVLIDFENVQPSDLAMLRNGSFKVKVFLGAAQAKIPVAMAAALQGLGEAAEYVMLQSSGSNALDFHIAYYIGRLSSEQPDASFHVISRDTGFDPLIRHLHTQGILVQRSHTIAAMPCFQAPHRQAAAAHVDVVVGHLVKMKLAKPRTEKTLRSTVHALFKQALSDAQLDELLDALRKRGIVRMEGSKVSYHLPVPSAPPTTP